MSSIKRIAVIGGGVVGSETAYALFTSAKQTGLSIQVDIYEKKKESDHRPVCTGLFTTAIETFFENPLSSYPFLKNTLTETVIHTDDKTIPPLAVPVNEYLVDRTRFDYYVRNRAQQAGATFHYSQPVQGITTTHHAKHSLILRSNKKKTKTIKTTPYDTVIVTTGASHLKIDGKSYDKPVTLTGAQYRVTIDSVYPTPHRFECHFVKENPDFFFWVVPEDRHHLRIGTASKQEVRSKLDAFMKQWIDKQRFDIKQTRLQAAPIPLFSRKYRKHKKQFEYRGIFFLGDAKGDIKDTTGGGIVPAFQNAHRFAKWYCTKYTNTVPGVVKSHLNRLHQEQQLFLHHFIMQQLRENDFHMIQKLSVKLSDPKTKQILSTTSRDKILSLALLLILSKPSLLSTFFSLHVFKRRNNKK